MVDIVNNLIYRAIFVRTQTRPDKVVTNGGGGYTTPSKGGNCFPNLQ